MLGLEKCKIYTRKRNEMLRRRSIDGEKTKLVEEEEEELHEGIINCCCLRHSRLIPLQTIV